MSGLLEELRRRNVIRMALLYLVGAWLIVQVAGTVLPMFGAPPWVPRTIVVVLALGLVPALVFSWVYELTPEGLKRDAEVDRAQSIAPHTARRMDRMILAGVALIVVLLLGQWLWPQESSQPLPADAPHAAAAGSAPSSIAVLPFVNMSEDKDNEHFGDGLSEELLNLLAQVPQLRVAARTSSFHFKGKDATIAEIADALQVDTVLEGSVRRSGNTMRVVAQLISARDGVHLWSEKYDRELHDIFEVQDDIAAQILKALRPQLGAGEDPLPKSVDSAIAPELFERFLLARNMSYDVDRAKLDRAHEEFLAITRAAPAYAPAYAWLARSWLGMEERRGGSTPPSITLPAAQGAIDTALSLDPREAMAHFAQGLLWIRQDQDDKALAAFEQALSLNPTLVDAYLEKQYALARGDRVPEAIQALEAARRIDPLHPLVIEDLSHLLNLQGRKAEAFGLLERLYQVAPGRAPLHEMHLYSDNSEWARMTFLGELEHVADDKDEAKASMLARHYRTAGLHDRPLALSQRDRYLSLAALGRRDEALAAMRERQAEVEDPQLRARIQWQTHLALGDKDEARAALLEMWRRNASRRIGNEFAEADAIALASLLHGGQSQERPGVVVAIETSVREMSPLHSAGVQLFQGYLALLQDRADDAVALFDALASSGFSGWWGSGKPLPAMFLFDLDPRFAPIVSRIVANRDAQLAALERLRASGMTAAQARAEYVAGLPVGAGSR